MITECPHCSARVLPTKDGQCPSCRKNIKDKKSETKSIEVEVPKQTETPVKRPIAIYLACIWLFIVFSFYFRPVNELVTEYNQKNLPVPIGIQLVLMISILLLIATIIGLINMFNLFRITAICMFSGLSLFPIIKFGTTLSFIKQKPSFVLLLVIYFGLNILSIIYLSSGKLIKISREFRKKKEEFKKYNKLKPKL